MSKAQHRLCPQAQHVGNEDGNTTQAVPGGEAAIGRSDSPRHDQRALESVSYMQVSKTNSEWEKPAARIKTSWARPIPIKFFRFDPDHDIDVD
jgi:hypothetical protein